MTAQIQLDPKALDAVALAKAWEALTGAQKEILEDMFQAWVGKTKFRSAFEHDALRFLLAAHAPAPAIADDEIQKIVGQAAISLDPINNSHARHMPMDFYRALFTALAHAPAPGIADGWQLVPLEPTEAILDGFWRQSGESREMRARVHERARYYWRAMLTAAPQAKDDDNG